VPHGEAVGHDVLGVEVRVLEPERPQHALLDELLEGRAPDDLERPSGDVEGGVVVGEGRVERDDLREVGHPLHHGGERVLAAAGVVEEVSDPAAHVREQVAHGRGGGDGFVAEAQVRQVRAHRDVQVEPALFD
jgi:hypothetical protein